MEGWIKLHRACLDHWLFTEYRPLTRQEAWIRILLTVNYDYSKSLIKGQLYECGPGQSLLSLESWARNFVWSIQQVRTFFKLLEADGMIKTEGLQYTTRLTVCNWDIYQEGATGEEQADNRPPTDGQHAANTPPTTTKESKESKEEEKRRKKKSVKNDFDFRLSLLEIGVDENVAADWMIVRKHKKASNTETAFDGIKKQIELSGLSANECIKIAVERSWQGFKAEWLLNDKNSINGNTRFKNTTASGSSYESPANAEIFCGIKKD